MFDILSKPAVTNCNT